MIRFEQAKQIWKQYHLGFYASVAGSFVMGTIHLVSVCMHFDWIIFNYMLFCYLMMLTRVFMRVFSRHGKKGAAYLVGSIALVFLLFPLVASLVMTMLYKDAPSYIFDWMLYAYALYAFVKMGVAIKNIVKSEEEKKPFSYLSLISAAFTMFMLEFSMIKTYSKDGAMFPMLLWSQGVIIAFTLLVLGLFAFRYIKAFRQREKTPLDSQG